LQDIAGSTGSQASELAKQLAYVKG
jgi:chromosome segregation ATPase